LRRGEEWSEQMLERGRDMKPTSVFREQHTPLKVAPLHGEGHLLFTHFDLTRSPDVALASATRPSLREHPF
jgi:hypothetical protein